MPDGEDELVRQRLSSVQDLGYNNHGGCKLAVHGRWLRMGRAVRWGACVAVGALSVVS